MLDHKTFAKELTASAKKGLAAAVDRDGFVTRAGQPVGQVARNTSGRGGRWMARPQGDAHWTYADTKAEAVAMCRTRGES